MGGAVEVVLGVSMTPVAVRMVLVEGEDADGVTVDHDTLPISTADNADAAVEAVVAAIVGTRDSAVESGHRLVSAGVAWSDHAAAARLTAALRAHGVNDVVLVSELHAAGALARAVGGKTGRERTALLLTDSETATLAVVRSSDGAVVKVHTVDSIDDLCPILAGLPTIPEPPEAVFLIGPGAAAMKSQLATLTRLPVHAPGDAELALARGAALACAGSPRFEAETVGLAPDPAPDWDDPTDHPTEAVATQLAAAYSSALGYSAVRDDEALGDADVLAYAEPEPQAFSLLGSAVAALFMVGVIALAISLAVAVRPSSDQPPGPVGTASSPGRTTGAPPQTIPAPVPVVQQAPRTVFATPAPRAVVPAPVVPPVALPAAPQVPAPAPAAPAVVPAAPVIPPVLVPILTPLWQQAPVSPGRATVQQTPTAPSNTAPSTTAPSNTAPSTTAPSTTVPSNTAPSTTAPSSTAPSNTAPSTPESTAADTSAITGAQTPAEAAEPTASITAPSDTAPSISVPVTTPVTAATDPGGGA